MSKKGTSRIVIGIILILLQVLSVLGNAKGGNSLPSLSFSSTASFFFSFAVFLGYWLVGIVGLILLISGCYARSKGSNQEEPSEQTMVIEKECQGSPLSADSDTPDEKPLEERKFLADDSLQTITPQKAGHKAVRLSPIVNEPNSEHQLSAPAIPNNIKKQGNSKTLFAVVSCVCVIAIACAFIFGYMAIQNRNSAEAWKASLASREAEAESWKKQLTQAKTDLAVANEEISELADYANFLKTKIGFIVDGSEYYHTYDCPVFRDASGYQAHNLKYCKHLGHSECPLCWD